eukprot:PhM_4_TR9260/c0_g1_i2/m.75849/K07375/TUBB; tubulin beta
MREVITVQIGQTGNRIGTNFWETVALEHALDERGLCRIMDGKQQPFDFSDERCLGRRTLYRETASRGHSHQYVPRAVLVDLEPSAVDSIHASPLGPQFPRHHTVVGKTGSGGLWPSGCYGNGKDLHEQVMDVVRGQVEACDSPESFQLIFSLSGGTGSGMGSLLLGKLRERYPNCCFMATIVLPSMGSRCRDSTLAPYNALLGMYHVLELSTSTICLDNEALHRSVLKREDEPTETRPPFSSMNRLAGEVLSDVTAGMRFPGQLNTSVRRLEMNLVPFPRLHLFCVARATTSISTTPVDTLTSEHDLIHSVLHPSNSLITTRRSNRHYAGAVMMRGAGVSMGAVEESIRDYLATSELEGNEGNGRFVPWISDSLKVSSCCVSSGRPSKNNSSRWSATSIVNSAQIIGPLQSIVKNYEKMFSRRMYLSRYFNEGMQEVEFMQAHSDIKDTIEEYKPFVRERSYESSEEEECEI